MNFRHALQVVCFCGSTDKLPSSSFIYHTLGQFGDISKPFTPASRTVTVERSSDLYGNTTTRFQTKEMDLEIMTGLLGGMSEAAQEILVFGFIAGERQGWRGNRATFTIDEFLEYKGLDKTKNNRDYMVKKFDFAAKELVVPVISLRMTQGKATRGQKIDALRNTHLVQETTRERYTGACELVFSPAVLSAARMFFAIIPIWSGTIDHFLGKRLTWLVYQRMSINKSGTVNISNRDILAWLGLPTEKEMVPARDYRRRMMEPVERAFESIEAASNGTLKIRPSNDWGKVYDFLNGYTQFEADADAVNHFKRMKATESKRREAAKRKKDN